ncbi:MAG: exonuclease SbcCD subunit D [Chloroflexi bacterium]|jgi:DNA repair protein SbcD/Mre11|nr:exonuclease SbcCD subunit D [Chloroflexota bacterium]MBT3671001.1 exonuclease SbcCD subunit D [Chloroflexota bacterium]MBT4002333.1 exonuclease SbcCD subunit D [Chloroflexota bacterium]MBT4305034.1 exonuclease SbcCD subunit D [Chloroflexota bacterium]MBT4533845.1 exonuclease SbcCD subunit D [Chloroflexota bacterium]
MIKILHFADAHIDMANYGRLDPETGLPMRVMDFLNSLDEIIDTALAEKVDLVIFAGDAYKDRNPAPTYQREWGRRIIKLSEAGIPCILVVGNHDLSPSLGRAHALEEFNTLNVPNILVADQPKFYGPDDLDGLQVQVLAIPWITRSGMLAYLDMKLSNKEEINEELETRLAEILTKWLEEADPNLPIILTAHASIQGAVYGGERTVMLGGDLVLSGSLVKNPQIDYVALGHIHKPQNLNEGKHPPVIYPGSIERVDFGEAKDDKFFIIAEVNKGETKVDWRQLKKIRKFIDRSLDLTSDNQVTEQIKKILPSQEMIKDAILRLVITYPRDWETLIDDAALREYTRDAFEFHFVKRPQIDSRVRIPEDKTVGSLTPAELLDIYWRSSHQEDADITDLKKLAQEIIKMTDKEEF